MKNINIGGNEKNRNGWKLIENMMNFSSQVQIKFEFTSWFKWKEHCKLSHLWKFTFQFSICKWKSHYVYLHANCILPWKKLYFVLQSVQLINGRCGTSCVLELFQWLGFFSLKTWCRACIILEPVQLRAAFKVNSVSRGCYELSETKEFTLQATW